MRIQPRVTRFLPGFFVLMTGVAIAGQGGPAQSCRQEYDRSLELLRQDRTVEARDELRKCLAADTTSADIFYQMSRSHMIDFNQSRSAREAGISLRQVVEGLEKALQIDPAHLAALHMKHSVHRGRGNIYYDPSQAYLLAQRVLSIQPYFPDFQLDLAAWMGLTAARFFVESEARVPHHSLIGLDRAASVLDDFLQQALPFTTDEERGLLLLGKVQAKRGDHVQSLHTYRSALRRPLAPPERIEVFRGVGSAFYRTGSYREAMSAFLQAIEIQVNPVDLWLLKVTADRLGAAAPNIPDSHRFPLRDERVDPSDPPLLEFTNIASELGVNRMDGHGPCAWGDFDGDGDLDLVLAGRDTFIGLYRNDGARFVEVTGEVGLAGVPSGYSLNVVDYDNDGWLDIYLCLNGWSGPMPNRLFRNQGDGTFTDVSKEAGVADPGSGFVSLWGDLDNDGDLDLVVANGVLREGSTTQVYQNNGNRQFTNVTRQAGIFEPPEFGTIGMALGDYDRDGDLDLFVNGWAPAPNRLYRNEGDLRFREVADSAGVTQPMHAGFVCFFVDYNNDAFPDILAMSLAPWSAVLEGLSDSYSVASSQEIHPEGPRLFRNKRDGTFTDATFESRLFYPVGSMGGGVADLDNDGYVDIFFGTGDPQLVRLEPNRFFRNNGDGTFSDLTMFSGLGHIGKGHGVTFVDHDSDGDLDVYVQIGAADPGDMWENAFYRNEKGNRNHWLQVELVGSRSNRQGIGASLVARIGDEQIYREVKGSEGFGSTNPYLVTFGLGRRTRVDSLEVWWPSGAHQEVASPQLNQRIEIREPIE